MLDIVYILFIRDLINPDMIPINVVNHVDFAHSLFNSLHNKGFWACRGWNTLEVEEVRVYFMLGTRLVCTVFYGYLFSLYILWWLLVQFVQFMMVPA